MGNKYESPCHFCGRTIEAGAGVTLTAQPNPIELHYHKRCLRILADAATAEHVTIVEQIVPGVYGAKGAGPAVPPKQAHAPQEGEPPRRVNLPPRRKPGT